MTVSATWFAEGEGMMLGVNQWSSENENMLQFCSALSLKTLTQLVQANVFIATSRARFQAESAGTAFRYLSLR